MNKPRYKWRPLQRAVFKPVSEALITDNMRLNNMTREETLASLQREENTSVWINDIYQVQVRELSHGFVHLNIRRRDGAPILRDWRHFQWIKNQLVGEECEGIELYPAESRMVDNSNKYHIIASTDPTFRFPFDIFGGKRDVNYESGTTPGTRQRPL